MKKKFALFCSLLYVLFECPKAISVKGRKITVFATQSSNLTTEKCPETGSECDVTLVAKVLITLRVSQWISLKHRKMSSDESEFRVSYGSLGSEGSREETDNDYNVVCNQSDVKR